LKVAPLAVAGLLRERLFGTCTTVLTSATLTLGGTFDAMARLWGLPVSPSPAVKAAGNRDDKHLPLTRTVHGGPDWSRLAVRT